MVRDLWYKATHLPRTLSLPAVAFLLAQGSWVGLLVLRAILEERWPSWEFIRGQFAYDATTYVYMVVGSTTIFTAWAYLLGRQQENLTQVAITDSLTGLYNRRHLVDRMAHELSRSARYNSPITLLLIDVDNLKKINDEGGHQAGDEAIRMVSSSIRKACRATDLAARLGGDEFAVLAPSTRAAEARVIATRLLAILQDLRDDGEKAPTVSVGIAECDSRTPVGVHDLMAAADSALYQAKSQGRNRAMQASAIIPMLVE
ncbi:MAG: hypothetical protein GMKNLPBB_01614 [Myxococcota bacterium]|nr:hypothetical protein [Myxococcota bacterium]